MSTLVVRILILFLGLSFCHAQERVPREESLRAAFALCLNLREMVNTPIPTDPDVKRPQSIRGGERGALVLPETRLSAETFAKLGKETKAVGQLWLRKLAPLRSDGQTLPPSSLRTVRVKVDDKELDVVCCALGARRNPDGQMELLVYGSGLEPLLRVPLSAVSTSAEDPIEMSAEREGNIARIKLTFAARHEATLTVGQPED